MTQIIKNTKFLFEVEGDIDLSICLYNFRTIIKDVIPKIDAEGILLYNPKNGNTWSLIS